MRWNIPVYLEFDTVLRGVEPNAVLAAAVARRAKRAAGWRNNPLHGRTEAVAVWARGPHSVGVATVAEPDRMVRR